MLLEAVRVLLEAVRVIIEAVRKIIETVRLFVEAVRVLVEAVRVLQSLANKSIPIRSCEVSSDRLFCFHQVVPRRLFFAALQRIAISWKPKYYQKMRCFITRKNQQDWPDVK